MITSQVHIGARTTLYPDQILLLEANINYTMLYLTDGKKIIVSYHLGKLAKRLSMHKSFIRPNRYTIVNLNYVSECDSDKLIINSQAIVISRRRKENIKMIYDEFLLNK